MWGSVTTGLTLFTRMPWDPNFRTMIRVMGRRLGLTLAHGDPDVKGNCERLMN